MIFWHPWNGIGMDRQLWCVIRLGWLTVEMAPGSTIDRIRRQVDLMRGMPL